MNYTQWLEENAPVDRAARFAGFDRGDTGHDDAVYAQVIARQSCVAGRLILERLSSCCGTEYALHFDGDGYGSLYFGENESQARVIAAWWLAGANP